MSETSGIDWEDAFANAAFIPDGMSYPGRWARRAAQFRDHTRGTLDITYGDHPRERFDLFRPSGDCKGLVVIIHGGFWIGFDKSSWSDLAGGALGRDWAVALPSYTLAPEARISQITCQIAAAITSAAQIVSGPIHLVGHSAGGHLATRMICHDRPLASPYAERIERVVSISGIHDLRPLRLHSMNAKLQLDDKEVANESPVLQSPIHGPEVVGWVGLLERPEFLRQSSLLIEAWRKKGASTELVVEQDRHHFNVIDGLRSVDHPLTNTILGN